MNSPQVSWDDSSSFEPRTEADFAALRVLGRTTVGKSFSLNFGPSEYLGAPARTIWQIISEHVDRPPGEGGKEEEMEIHRSPAGRVQVKARVVRDKGHVIEIRFEKVTGRAGRDATIQPLLNLDADASKRLVDVCLAIRGIDPTGTDTVKIDEEVLAAVFENPHALAAVYSEDPERFSALIEADVTARDVVAIAARRSAVAQFEDLLNNPEAFEAARGGGGREAVWQRFFEANPWLLGVGLSGSLLTSWDPEKLERTVAGSSIAEAGKRVDALLATTGLIRSLVFAELKLHDDPLLESSEYRSGAWAPSREVMGGIAQAHTTAERARDDLGQWLGLRDKDGFRSGEQIFAGSPRSFLVVGSLGSLARDGQINPDMVRSFELFRKHLTYPEVVTYDEVLARARWSLDLIDPPVNAT